MNAGLYKGVCVSGDFNFPDLRWSDDSVINRGKHDGLAGAFLDTLEDLSLYQAVRVPTFFSASGTSSNVLDLILCDRSERIDIKNVNSPLGSASQDRHRHLASLESLSMSFPKVDQISLKNL